MKTTFKSINSRLARRLSMYVVLASTFIAIFTSGVQIYTEYNREVEGVLAGLEQIEQTHLSNIASRLWVLDSKELKTTLTGQLSLPSVKYVAVYDNKTLYMEVGINTDVDIVERSYVLYYSHKGKKMRIGRLIVKASLQQAYQHIIDRAILIIASNTIKTFVVAGLILLIFYRLVARHLHKFAEFAQQLDIDSLDSTFEFDRRKNPAGSQDELDLVRAALSKMQRNLIEAIQGLQEREQDLATTLNSIGDAVITTDASGQVTRMNPVAEQLTGWSLAEARGQPLKDIFSIIDVTTRKPIENPIEKVIATGATFSLSNHTTLIARDGTEYQIADSAAPIHDNDLISGMVLVFNDVTEQYQLRQAIAKDKRDLQAIMDHSPAVIYVKDTDGHYIFINQQFEKLFHAKREDIVGKTDHDVFSDDFAEEFQRNDKAVLTAGHAIESEEATPHEDGLHTYSSHRFPLLNEEGNIYAICGISTDITVRKRGEEALRESNERLRGALDASQTGTWRVDLRTGADTRDASLNRMLGLPAEPSTQPVEDWFTYVHPDDVDKTKLTWEQGMETGLYVVEHRLIRKDGKILWVYDRGQMVRDDEGQLQYAIGAVMDITSQHKTQQTLRDKEREQREILNTIMDGVITIDEASNILTFNKAAETLFGYTAEEIVGKNLSQLIPESYQSRHEQGLQRYLKTGKTKVIGADCGVELEVMHKNGSRLPARLSIAELPVDANGKRRFIGSCQDLTQIKQQEEQLRRSQRMDALGKLTGGIAHDFNNMLGIVIGYADLLEARLVDQPKLVNYAHEIHHAGERGVKLTKKLLTFSRQEAPEAARLDINKLLQQQQDLLQKTLTVRIKLLFELDDRVWPVWLDSSDLEDAILNISINAMHAMSGKKSGAQLTIRTCNRSLEALDVHALGLQPGDYVQLSLSDTGCGMDAEIKERIFDPFFTTKGEQGTGLGLSQVIGFVNRAGGSINVYSEPGYGSKFALYFPRYFEGAKDSTAETSGDVIELRGKENILIVDDEAALRDLVSVLLSQQGYQVFCAAGGKQALEILEHEPIDLMLSDVIMPGMDGYKLAVIVQGKYPGIKIQLASGFSGERHVGIIDESLYQNLLHKPYESPTLLKRIRTLLDNEIRPASKIPKKKSRTRKKILPPLTWISAFSTGIPEIDKDHKVLLTLLNRCIEVANGARADKELNSILNALIDYTHYHFQREERIMEACDYPELQKHRKAHQLLLRAVKKYKNLYDRGDLVANELLVFLSSWLKDHIMGMDKEIASYCKGKRKQIQRALKK